MKPCPFCGADPTMEPWHGGAPTKQRIGCDNQEYCDVLPGVTGETPQEAAARWNARAPATPPAAAPALAEKDAEIERLQGQLEVMNDLGFELNTRI